MTILHKILETKRDEVDTALRNLGFEETFRAAQTAQHRVVSFSAALQRSSPAIIAEFKRKSPSKGWFTSQGADAGGTVQGYAARGAAAISVLTDWEYFGGTLTDLLDARAVTNLPLLRKDFIIDPFQICEARVAGAGVILLIAAALSTTQCAELAHFARELKLEVLLEIHNEEELKYINPHVNVVGVNNRNLSTFETDIAVSERLALLIPNDLPKISESGISHPDTVKHLHSLGYCGFLMGENFMKYPSPTMALEQFIAEL